MKYQISDAAANRVATTLVLHNQKSMAATSYADVVRAIEAEDISTPDRAMIEIHDILLRNESPAAGIIGRAALREARDTRETLSALRRAFSMLGLASVDEIKPEALKEGL